MEYSELKKRYFGTNDTDKKLTDDEIIKALACCSEACSACDECPLYCCGANCSSFELHRYALDLTNRQKAEIERLKECPKCVYEYDGETMEYCVQAPCPNFKGVITMKNGMRVKQRKEDEGKCQK